MYSDLVESLKEIKGVAFTEHEWATRPAGNHGTVQIDFSPSQDSGDDEHQAIAYQGSVDLYTRGQSWQIAAQVESVLEGICGASWYLNLKTYEHETGLLHREYVFELEAL